MLVGASYLPAGSALFWLDSRLVIIHQLSLIWIFLLLEVTDGLVLCTFTTVGSKVGRFSPQSLSLIVPLICSALHFALLKFGLAKRIPAINPGIGERTICARFIPWTLTDDEPICIDQILPRRQFGSDPMVDLMDDGPCSFLYSGF